MKEKTLNELWVENDHQLTKGKINLVVAPAGSGKTFWIFNTLVKNYKLNKVLYLCDTSALAEAVANDENYKHLCILEDSRYEGFEPRVRVMTYSKYGKRIEKDPNYFGDIDLIICDEAHNLYNYKIRFDDKDRDELTYTNVVNGLFSKVEEGKTDIIFTTATHRRILEGCSYTEYVLDEVDGVLTVEACYNFNHKHYKQLKIINMELMYSNIKKLKENSTYFFSNYKNVIYHLRAYNGFKWGKKCLIYTDRITTIKEMESICSNIGLRAVGIWSKHNKKNEMDEYQWSIRKGIIETGLIPNDIDVLIINASYETGINIKKENDIQFVIVNSTDKDTQIQARARVRDNIHMLLLKGNDDTENIVISLDCKWINRNLTKEDKEQLCKEYPMYNEKDRLVKWTTMKRTLENSGYIVKGDKISIKKYRDTRVDIISESPKKKLIREKQEEWDYLINTFS